MVGETEWSEYLKAAIALELNSIVAGEIARNSLFQKATHPKIIRKPLFNRYDVGTSYGNHIDAAMMDQPPIRSDLSNYVIFKLSDGLWRWRISA